MDSATRGVQDYSTIDFAGLRPKGQEVAVMPSRFVVMLLALVFGAPAEARFLQADPIGVEAGTNLYAYVANDPLNAIDPSGLQEISSARMKHILQSHGFGITTRTRPNSVFSPEYSFPTELRQLSLDVFNQPISPPQPLPFAGLYAIQGGVFLRDNANGALVPYMIGTDKNGRSTNEVQIWYRPNPSDINTGPVETMVPVEMTGTQTPQNGFNLLNPPSTLPASLSQPVPNSGATPNSTQATMPK